MQCYIGNIIKYESIVAIDFIATEYHDNKNDLSESIKNLWNNKSAKIYTIAIAKEEWDIIKNLYFIGEFFDIDKDGENIYFNKLSSVI